MAKNMVMTVLLLFLLSQSAYSGQYSYQLLPEDSDSPTYMQVKILSSLGLSAVSEQFGKVSELSGIAWDFDEKKLYAVTDEGLLHHFSLTLKEGVLERVTLLASYRLSDHSGKKLKSKKSDSEGLALVKHDNGVAGDSELIISFEHKPRVSYFDLEGKEIKRVVMPKKISKKKYLRHPNKGLESVTRHPQYGIITAAELPLKSNPKNRQTLYSEKGYEWNFDVPSIKNSSVTGMELLPDGNIMVLERAWSGITAPVIINLRKIYIDKCKKKLLCKSEAIATFSSDDGWLLDNFEGLTYLGKNHYLMVSDDNENPFQSTVFATFEYPAK